MGRTLVDGYVITRTAVLTEEQYKLFKKGYYIVFPHINLKGEKSPVRLYSEDEVMDNLGLKMKGHYRDEESCLEDCQRIDEEIYANEYYIYGGSQFTRDCEEREGVDWSIVKVDDKYVIIRAYYTE